MGRTLAHDTTYDVRDRPIPVGLFDTVPWEPSNDSHASKNIIQIGCLPSPTDSLEPFRSNTQTFLGERAAFSIAFAMGESSVKCTGSVFLPRKCYRQKACSICAVVIPFLGCLYVAVRRVCVLYLLTCRGRPRRRRHVGRSDQSSICSFFFVFF